MPPSCALLNLAKPHTPKCVSATTKRRVAPSKPLDSAKLRLQGRARARTRPKEPRLYHSMLLILTPSEEDLTAHFLDRRVKMNRHLPYFRLNSEDLITAEFTFSLNENGVRRDVCVASKTLDFDKVTAVWYRRTIQPSFMAALSPGERTFVAGELRHFATGLVLNSNVNWVNPIDRVSVAEHKLYQLQIARQLGFRVPRTLVSRNPVELRKFCERNEAGTICKPIFHGMFFDEISSYSVFTRRVTPESIDRRQRQACPVLLQEEIPRICGCSAHFYRSEVFCRPISRGDASLSIFGQYPDVSAQLF